MKFGVVTEVSTFLVITQVSNGLKKLHDLIFSNLHVKLASLANIKSCVTVNVWPCTVSVDYIPLRLSPRYFFTTVLGCHSHRYQQCTKGFMGCYVHYE